MHISSCRQAQLPNFRYFRSASEKLKITVIFMGENHKDLTVPGYTRQCMSEFYKAKIDQMHCPEHPFDLSFEAQAEAINQWMVLNNYLLKIEEIKNLRIQGECAFPYFSKEQEQKITDILGEKFPHLKKSLHHSAMMQLCKDNYYKEVSLLNQLHRELSIPYQGIELANDAFLNFSRKVMINPELLFEYEKIRIEAMTKNIVEKALPKLKNNGGVIFVNTGLSHTLNLATSVHHHIAKNLLNHEYSFQMIANICYSAYVKDSIQSNLKDIPRAVAALENEELIALSKKIPVNLIEITEIGKHRYQALKLDPLIQNVIKNHSSPTGE